MVQDLLREKENISMPNVLSGKNRYTSSGLGKKENFTIEGNKNSHMSSSLREKENISPLNTPSSEDKSILDIQDISDILRCPPSFSLENIRDILKILSLQGFGHDIFQDWLRHLFPLSWDQGILTLGVCSSFLHNWIELHYLEPLVVLLKKEYQKEKENKGSSLFRHEKPSLQPDISTLKKEKKIKPKKESMENFLFSFSAKDNPGDLGDIHQSLSQNSLTQKLSLGLGSLPPLDHVRLITITSQEGKDKGYNLEEPLFLGNSEEDIYSPSENIDTPKALPGFEDFAPQDKKGYGRRKKNIETKPTDISLDHNQGDLDHLTNNNINPGLTFENFVVGSPNEFAYLSAQRISEHPDILYNPLFLYGPVGHGKTHLMQAIANKTKELFGPKKTLLYLSAEQFMYDFVRSLRYGTIIQFKERFRHVHMLLLDDFQFIGGKEATQEEFFHIFNFLLDTKRQLIISADKSPKDLEGIQDRMRSRLGWGLTADLHPTTFELRLSILRTKAQEQNLVLGSDILDFLAQNLISNVRQLEGALRRLKAHEEFSLCGHWTLELVGFILKDWFSPPGSTSLCITEDSSFGRKKTHEKKKNKHLKTKIFLDSGFISTSGNTMNHHGSQGPFFHGQANSGKTSESQSIVYYGGINSHERDGQKFSPALHDNIPCGYNNSPGEIQKKTSFFHGYYSPEEGFGSSSSSENILKGSSVQGGENIHRGDSGANTMNKQTKNHLKTYDFSSRNIQVQESFYNAAAENHTQFFGPKYRRNHGNNTEGHYNNTGESHKYHREGDNIGGHYDNTQEGHKYNREGDNIGGHYDNTQEGHKYHREGDNIGGHYDSQKPLDYYDCGYNGEYATSTNISSLGFKDFSPLDTSALDSSKFLFPRHGSHAPYRTSHRPLSPQAGKTYNKSRSGLGGHSMSPISSIHSISPISPISSLPAMSLGISKTALSHDKKLPHKSFFFQQQTPKSSQYANEDPERSSFVPERPLYMPPPSVSQGYDKKTISLFHICSCVAAFFHLHPRELCSSRRQRCFTRPRQVAMFLAKATTPYSLPIIGRYFGGRNHTTVLHAVEAIDDLMQKEEQFKYQIEDLKNIICQQHEPPVSGNSLGGML